MKLAFIKPEALEVIEAEVVGKFEAAVEVDGLSQPGFDMGEEPSPPHVFDVEPILAASPIDMDPGSPPPLVVQPHYTQVLDEIWPEFDAREDRTAARLQALLDEVKDEAQRVHLLAQSVWEKLPSYKVPDSERKRYQAEFLSYLKRLRSYGDTLRELEPEDTATETVYVGLVRRRESAGPVPDAIMHMYFAQQLGILSDHAEDMGEGFVGRFMDGLAQTGEAIDDAREDLDETKKMAEERFDQLFTELGEAAKRGLLWGGVILGAGLLIGGTIAIARVANRREPDEV
ncbi:hypothetical protein PPSIR1_21394 [Plesiocystis pacifica SIR-1]|uniref:Uncharacterized protein n=1 Tax=Plesiocystis pacifica SIR-1 TaxID=391625 RepID=A6G3L8_9BACT|nr:hypothetical protein PPSIR1_21394 [Plesiocystis pacifica SIR-1]